MQKDKFNDTENNVSFQEHHRSRRKRGLCHRRYTQMVEFSCVIHALNHCPTIMTIRAIWFDKPVPLCLCMQDPSSKMSPEQLVHTLGAIPAIPIPCSRPILILCNCIKFISHVLETERPTPSRVVDLNEAI